MIASLGGAIVNDDGSRSYPGSGGLVGGLSFEGANYSKLTGAGYSYNRFTPQTVVGRFNALLDYEIPVDTPGDGPVIITGSPSPPVNNTPPPSGQTTGTSVIVNPGGYFQTPNNPYRGLGSITSGGSQLINSLNRIFSDYQSGQLTLSQATLLANQLRGYLSNPSVFYQAQRGRDASALNNFKSQATAIVNAIVSWVRPSTPSPEEPTPCNGIPNCGRTPPYNPTEIPNEIPKSITDLLALLTPTERTKVEVPPNLYQFTPPVSGSFTSGSGNNMNKIIILVAVVAVAYFVYKKYV